MAIKCQNGIVIAVDSGGTRQIDGEGGLITHQYSSGHRKLSALNVALPCAVSIMGDLTYGPNRIVPISNSISRFEKVILHEGHSTVFAIAKRFSELFFAESIGFGSVATSTIFYLVGIELDDKTQSLYEVNYEVSPTLTIPQMPTPISLNPLFNLQFRYSKVHLVNDLLYGNGDEFLAQLPIRAGSLPLGIESKLSVLRTIISSPRILDSNDAGILAKALIGLQVDSESQNHPPHLFPSERRSAGGEVMMSVIEPSIARVTVTSH